MIAHRPSFDIAFPRANTRHFRFAAAIYHSARRIARKIRQNPFRGNNRFIPPLQRARADIGACQARRFSPSWMQQKQA
jgi:hypothetical protein